MNLGFNPRYKKIIGIARINPSYYLNNNQWSDSFPIINGWIKTKGKDIEYYNQCF